MKINFTKKEFRLLLEIVYLGQWMVKAHEGELPDENDEHEMLVQKIYSFSKEMGCGDLIEPVKELNKFYPTSFFEEDSRIQDIIDEYNNDTFWDELINRLAERDARADAKASNQEISSAKELWKLITPHESRYADEFSKNGLKNLTVGET